MLLKGARLITYGAALAAIGIILVMISTYTPFGKRVLFLVSGLPVLLVGRLAGFKAGLTVYATTSLILLLLVHPLKGLGYLLLAGGVPLLMSLERIPGPALGAASFALSMAYLSVGFTMLGLPVDRVLAEIGPLLPLDATLLGVSAVLILSLLYPVGLGVLQRGIEKHWAFKQIFRQ